MYKSPLLDPEAGPTQLQNKVQFNIRYYFTWWGAENIYGMTKGTFKVVNDHDINIYYITKAVDKETKNHEESDSEIISGYMPEIPDRKYCPLQSYLTYKISFDTISNDLWQQPRMSLFPAELGVDPKGLAIILFMDLSQTYLTSAEWNTKDTPTTVSVQV